MHIFQSTIEGTSIVKSYRVPDKPTAIAIQIQSIHSEKGLIMINYWYKLEGTEFKMKDIQFDYLSPERYAEDKEIVYKYIVGDIQLLNHEEVWYVSVLVKNSFGCTIADLNESQKYTENRIITTIKF